MEEILYSPILWVSVVVFLISLAVVMIFISSKRSREVKELDKMFPEGKLSGENLEKIPVEKVRRTTLKRERKKEEREKELPKRIRPKKGEKVFAEEDQEFILNTPTNRFSQSNDDVKQKPLKPRKRSADETPVMDQKSHQESLKKDPLLSRSSRTQKQSPDIDQEEAAKQMNATKEELKPKSSNRFYQSREQRANYSEKTMPSRSQRNKQEATDVQESNEDTSQSLSRSKRYSVKKRLF